MKKVFFSLVAMSFFATTIISCQSNQKEAAESDTVKTEPAAEKVVAKVDSTGVKNLDVSPDVVLKFPQFSSEDVNEGLAKFEPLKQEYIAALNSKDKAKINEVVKRFEKWFLDIVSWSDKLSQDERPIYTDYYTQITTQWDKITARYTK
jgi:hypothetical protein